MKTMYDVENSRVHILANLVIKALLVDTAQFSAHCKKATLFNKNEDYV